MKVGVPTEIKADEYRVALTPTGVRELVDFGHEVVVQHGAGEGSAIEDSRYVEQGAAISSAGRPRSSVSASRTFGVSERRKSHSLAPRLSGRVRTSECSV